VPSHDLLRSLASEIVTKKISSEGLRRFIYSGHCMSPVLQDGNLIFAQKVPPQKLWLGDIVVFTDKGTNYIHRFLYRKKDARGFLKIITKADRNLKSDFPVEQSHFVGKVVEIKARNKRISLEGKLFRVISFFVGTISIVEAVGAGLFNKIHLDFLIRGSFRRLLQSAIQSPNWFLQKIISRLL
jgi:signal peptidase I